MRTDRSIWEDNSTIPYRIRSSAVNDWTIPFTITSYWFDKYYILHWQGAWLAEQVSNGVILHDGVRYRINWITVPSLCYKADDVMLSYRRIYGREEGYVLIKVKS